MKIHAEDFDNDGDIDLVLGNAGENLPWKPTKQEPMELYAYDFDTNGTIDPIITSYYNGVSYPLPSRDEILEQISALKKKFVSYKDYANASIEDLFNKELLEKAIKLKINTLQSVYVENLGNEDFLISPLPLEAQFSAVNSILSADYDGDGNRDLLISGNFFPYRVQTGRSDAGIGQLLKGDGKGNFKPVDWQKSGFVTTGDVRDMKELNGNLKHSYIIISKKNIPEI